MTSDAGEGLPGGDRSPEAIPSHPAAVTQAVTKNPRRRNSGAGHGRISRGLWLTLLAIGLTLVFWGPLWTGSGLIGGDIYAYFLPQKSFYAERLKAGELPLWNNRVGNGYPLVAESQTGAFYPLHAPLYLTLDLNTAYNASLILHYLLAFVFLWLYARRWGLSPIPAAFSALVYTYSWFPPRVSLEWAIIGGTWLPLALWLAESFLQTRWWRYLIGLVVALAVQMLAGHFTLAFVTQLTLVGYFPLRLWLRNGELPAETEAHRGRYLLAAGLAVLAGFGLAAVQLAPTWELKQLSQRQSVSKEHDPGYGNIPPLYWSQAVAPWYWYPDDPEHPGTAETRLQRMSKSRTNRVEAHLYFGLVPLLLAVVSLLAARRVLGRKYAVWGILGGAAFFYTSGWFTGFTQHLPGFSFFEGLGRFGIVPTLAVALLAGAGMSLLISVRSSLLRAGIVIVAFVATTSDLWLVSRLVTSAWMVDTPPINALAKSDLRKVFAAMPQPVRILSEPKNLPSILGVGTTPVYLGLSPAEYFDPDLRMPEPLPFHTPPTEAQIDWLRRNGVTHFLSLRRLDERAWPVQLVWSGQDRFLNPAIIHQGDFWLYALRGTRGRVAWEQPLQGASARVTEYSANRVAIAAETPAPGTLVLTDLYYPGWEVTVDGTAAEPVKIDEMYRGVRVSAGNHAVVWTYRPRSLYWGLAISVLTGAVLLVLGHLKFWHPQWFARFG